MSGLVILKSIVRL